MVEVLELGGNVSKEVYPGAYSQRRPTLTSSSTPPCQSLSSKRRHSHFDLFHHVYHATYHAVLLQVEEPIGQLLGVSLKLAWLIEF